MRISLATALLASTLALPALAVQNVYELKKQDKAGTFAVTKSNTTIELAPSKTYDKYIISVSGDGGFSYQIESNSPTLNIYDLKLPYDGKYNYEIKAIQHLADVEETMNNGRPEGAVGKVSMVDITSGQFTTLNGEMNVVKELKEPRIATLPSTDK
jgi:hypothetical protein